MNSFLRSFLKLLVFVFILAAYACSSDKIENRDTINYSAVPELLDRADKIQLGKEWDAVQNQYVEYREDIVTENNNLSRLKLAQLFVKEARVTGEHGHYYPAALSILNELLAQDSIANDLKFMALVTKAGVELSLHEFATAKNTGLKALQLNDYNAQVYGVLVDAYVELGEYEKAIQMADKMVSIKPDLRSYSRISYLRQIHGEDEGALEAMKMAVDAGYPGLEESAWAGLTLSEMLMDRGRYEEAKNVLESVLAMRENYPFAIDAIGQIHMAQEDYDKAEQKFNEAIDIIPEIGYYINLAKLYKLQGREEELKQLRPEILAMLKDDVDSGHNMNLEYANLYHEIYPDYEKALQYALTEYEKRPDNIDVNKSLAIIYTTTENFDQAAIHLEKAQRTGTTDNTLRELNEKLK